ncbi:MAG: DUF58 domain-containing protein [Phycisphaerales bacterium]|jgi:uncharacterized protein (DUF58 family)
MITDPSAPPLPTTPERLLGPAVMARLDRLDVASRKLLRGSLPGERRSRRRGRSVEFDDFRDYAPGDDLRHVDWNIYARLDRLYVKLFREEEDLAVNILVDNSASMDMGSPGKLLFAHQLAFALAYVGILRQHRVSVATFAPRRRPDDPSLIRLAPLRGRSAARRIGGFLIDSLTTARASRPAGAARPEAAFNAALRSFAEHMGAKGVSLVISDFLSPVPFDAGLAALGARAMAGHADAWCLQVLSPQELDASLGIGAGLQGDLRLTDIESLEAIDVTVTPAVAQAHRTSFDSARERFREQCAGRGIAHALIPTDAALDQLLTGTIRRRGLLR